uniref:Uncharacterized protein n=1 Tax=Romanomermis culicivorax TaxID=13658 RepID=A0A915IHR6_ROMCU
MEAEAAQTQSDLEVQHQLEEILRKEEEVKQKIQLEQEHTNLRNELALMKARMEKLKCDIGFQREEDATLIEEQKAMEPPSPMKVEDNITTDKLVIEEDAAEMPDSEMGDTKVIQSMWDKRWNDERILFMAE